MVICSCQAVSDRTVLAVIADGATSVETVVERCAAASRCGGCLPELQRLIAEHAADRSLASAVA